jgi:hypothetical protein
LKCDTTARQRLAMDIERSPARFQMVLGDADIVPDHALDDTADFRRELPRQFTTLIVDSVESQARLDFIDSRNLDVTRIEAHSVQISPERGRKKRAFKARHISVALVKMR